jgi:hypothetical protein
MKSLFRYIPLLAMPMVIFSCKKDNVNPPASYLTGHLIYSGDTIRVEEGQVPFQLYQYGFGKLAPIGSTSTNTSSGSGSPVGSASTTFAQDGSFSAVLYDGSYKFLIPNGQGPFMWKQDAAGNPDTLNITLKGNQTVNIEVTPYYMIRNPQISASNGTVTATFKAEKIITDANAKDIERVSLYINKTQFVSGGSNIASADLDGASIADPNNISLSVAIPAISPTQNYVYARVGIKIANVEDMIFSPLIQLNY